MAEGFDGVKGDQVMKSFRFLLALALVCGIAGMASADVLMLKTGQAITGKYVGGDETSVAFSSEGRVRTYPVGDVTSITFAATPSATSSASSSSSPTYSSGRSSGPLPEADEPPVLRRTTPAPATTSSTPSRSADEPPVLRRTRPETATTSSASTSTAPATPATPATTATPGGGSLGSIPSTAAPEAPGPRRRAPCTTMP